MSAGSPQPSRLGCLVDLAVQLQRDAGRPDVELHRRDRQLAGQLNAPAPDRRALLIAWLDALRGSGQSLPGRQVSVAYRLQILALIILGLFIGWGSSVAVFYYDGSRPVNVVNVLAVFVGAQLLLLLLLGFVMLPARLTRILPGFTALQEMLAWLSPGQLARLALRQLPRKFREQIAQAVGQGIGPWPQFARVQKWAIVFAAQSFAVTFNLGALAAGLYLVTFSDLAFAWSTTLEPSVDKAHRLTQILAKPWSGLVPAATPNKPLIQATLYYRQTGTPPGDNPEHWGQWWPFLVACMVTYGLLPRLLLLGLAGWRFQSAVNRALLEAPGAAVVLDRLTSEVVTTRAAQAEVVAASDRTEANDRVPSPALADASPLCLINWGALELSDTALREAVTKHWRRDIVSVLHAGGNASLEADAETIAKVAALPGEPAIALFVKSWEPPVLEVVDYLGDLRRAIGPRRLIIVSPVGNGLPGQLAAPRERDAEQWRKRLQGLADAALVVRPWQEGGAA